MTTNVLKTDVWDPHGAVGNLYGFVRILRSLGVRASIAEVLDACKALLLIQFEHKEHFYSALKSCLVKSREESQLFDLAFTQFFVQSAEKQARLKQWQELEQQRNEQLQQAQQDLLNSLENWDQDVIGKLTAEQFDTFSRMPMEEQQKLKDKLEQMKANPVRDPSDLLYMVVQSSLQYWRYHMLQKESQEDIGRDLEIQLTGEEDLDPFIAGIQQDFIHRPEDNILYQDMQKIEEPQWQKVAVYIQRMSSRLASSMSRRYKKQSGCQQIDIRCTLRRNMKYGGVPLELCYQSRRPSAPSLLLLCDVSASMARYARFVIQFLYGMGSAWRNIESFLFAEDLERITPYFQSNKGFAQTMTDIMNQSEQWGKTTNLLQGLTKLREEFKHLIQKDTIFIIVSDTRTVAPTEALALLLKIKKHLHKTLWLNPLPVHLWSQYATVAQFKQHIPLFPCHQLSQLEKVLQTQLLKEI